MALKFRRGTTAQKSGSLAFGEPYVNTTLGTLQVGLDTGDLTLTSVGSTTQFGIQSISASAFVSASSIYSTNGITGSIAATNGVVSGSSQVSYVGLSNIPNGIISSSAQIDTLFNIDGIVSGSSQITYTEISSIPSGIVSSSVQVTPLLPTGVVSGSIQVLGGTGIVSGSSQITYANISSIPAGIVSGSAQVTPLLPTGVISGSSQLNNTSIENLTVVNLTTVNETASVLFSSGSNRFGDFGDDIHSFTGSVQISGSITTIGSSTATSFTGQILATNGIVSGSSQTIANLPTGTVSGSSQITLSSTTGGGTSDTPQFARLGIGKAADTLIGIDVTSAQGALQATTTGQSVTAYVLRATNALFDNSLFYGNTTRAGSSAFKLLDLRTDGGSTNEFYVDGNGAGWFASDVTASNFLGGIRATNGVVSGSSQITYASIGSIPAGIVSGSSQVVGSSITTNTISLNGTSVALGGTATIPNLVSGSSQITGIGNAQLTNSSTTIGTTAIALGASSTTLAGLTSVTSTAFVGALTGNASTATTAGTVTTAAQSAITSVGTLTSLTVSGATATGALTVTGAITATGDITAYFTSDKRHKNNIQTIPNALEKVSKLNGVTWEWNDDVNEVTKSTPKTGLIAQEVQEVLPEVVKTRDDGFLALDYSKMMGLMVEAIKEQQTQIHNLTLEIENLKKQKGL